MKFMKGDVVGKEGWITNLGIDLIPSIIGMVSYGRRKGHGMMSIG